MRNPPPARLAGALWLAVVALGFFALFGVRAALIVRDDPAATAARILGSESLFRAGVTADDIGGLVYLALTAILYHVLKPVSRSLAFASALFGGVAEIVTAVWLTIAGVRRDRWREQSQQSHGGK